MEEQRPRQRRTRTFSLRFLTATLGLSLCIGHSQVPSCTRPPMSRKRTQIWRLSTNTWTRPTSSREPARASDGVNIDAQLPSWKSTANSGRCVRSAFGQITYKALGFSGDNTVKQEVITRYLAAESSARENGTIAIRSELQVPLYGEAGPTWCDHADPGSYSQEEGGGLFQRAALDRCRQRMPVRESGQFVKTHPFS